MAEFKLKIVTPEKTIFTDVVTQVSVSTTTGQITILPNHIPLVSQLSPGEIVINHNGDQEDLMAVSGGFVEVLPDEVIVLADTAERAEDLLKTKVKDAKQFAMFTAMVEKELARLRVARKYKKKGVRTGIK